MLRFAHAPTGDILIGNLRVAILNYLVAKQQQNPFLIRIDDGDKDANIEGKDTEIMQILEKFALVHDSVFHQSEHLHMHQTLAIKLLEEDKAFVCTCSKERLQTDDDTATEKNLAYHYSGYCENKDKAEHAKLKASNTPFVLRLKKPTETIIIKDIIHDKIVINNDTIDAFVILNEDGTPSHTFASACDDMLSGINCIITTDKSYQDTAREAYIKKQLGYIEETSYTHIPSIEYKKDENRTVKWLFEQGFIPDAIINYLLLLGYKDAPKEIFTLPQAIEWFNIKNISNEVMTFDIKKLKHINREHLKRIDDKVLSSLFGFADADVGKLIKLYLEEASTITELATKIRPIFAPKVFEGVWAENMIILQKIIADSPMLYTYDEFESYIIKASGLKGEALYKPLRLLLTGTKEGPELYDIYPYIKSYLLEVAS